MDEAIFGFKRYEDSSLSYAGIDKHEGEDIGGWDTVVSRKEYERLFTNQQSTMSAPEQAEEDLPETPYVYVPDADEEKVVEAPKPKKAERNSEVTVRKMTEEGKPKADVSWVAVGVTVGHAKFGNGEVTVMKDRRVTVTFAGGEKTFEFPDVFEKGFLFKG